MNAIVDVQGFKTDHNKFILKELAILCDGRAQVYLLKLSYPFYEMTVTERKQVCWIERNKNIFWKEGYIPYSNSQYSTNVVNMLKDKNIFTKGNEKVLWLREILESNRIFNLEDKGCPSVLSL